MEEHNIPDEQPQTPLEAVEEYLSYSPVTYPLATIPQEKFSVWRETYGDPQKLSPSLALATGWMQVERAMTVTFPMLPLVRSMMTPKVEPFLADAAISFNKAQQAKGREGYEARLAQASLPVYRKLVTSCVTTYEELSPILHKQIYAVVGKLSKTYETSPDVNDVPLFRILSALALLNNPRETDGIMYMPLPVRMYAGLHNPEERCHIGQWGSKDGYFSIFRIGRRTGVAGAVDPIHYFNEATPSAHGHGLLEALKLIKNMDTDEVQKRGARYVSAYAHFGTAVAAIVDDIGDQNRAIKEEGRPVPQDPVAWYRSLSPRMHPVFENRQALDEAMSILTAKYWAQELSAKEILDLANMNLELADGLVARKDGTAISYYEVAEDIFKDHARHEIKVHVEDVERTPEHAAAHYASRWASAAAFMRKVISAQQFDLEEQYDFKESHTWYNTEIANIAYDVLQSCDDPKTTTQLDTLAHHLTAALVLADGDVPTIVVPASPRQQQEPHGFDMLLYPQTTHDTYLRGYTGRLRLRNDPSRHSLDSDTLTVTHEQLGQSSEQNLRVLRALMAKLTEQPYDEGLIERAKAALMPANLTAEL